VKDYSNAPWVDLSLGWKPRPVSELPERVLIDFATKCNLRCPMCPVWGSEDDNAIDAVKGVMDADNARRILDDMMAATPLIQPSMYGEPLLIPDLRARIKDMKSRNMTIAFNTNGLTLNESLAKFLVDEKVDSVFFSLEGVTRETLKKIRGVDKIEKIEAAIFRLIAARAENDLPRIGVTMVVQDGNRHERDAFVERWAGIVDCVRVGLIFENGTYPDMETPAKRMPCPAIYNTMPVYNDGTVTICCLDGFRSATVGNVLEQGVKEVWQGEAFAKVRYYHETSQWDKVPFCTNCNGWAQHEFQEEIRDGLFIRSSPQFTYYNRVDRLSNWKGRLLGGHPMPPTASELAAIKVAE
jgi:MoaA/NifB/PqqE/SkfB family radical SAM enzyme